MFKPPTQNLLPEPLREYLRSDMIKDWHSRYLKGYRDALAHRIPLYIPPANFSLQEADRFNQLRRQIADAISRHDWAQVDELQDQQDAIGIACYHFLHEYSADEDARPVQLHPQVLADSALVIEFGQRFYSLWHLYVEPQPPAGRTPQ